MAIRVQNMPRKSVGQVSVCSTPYLGNAPWWSVHEQHLPEALSTNLSLIGDSPSQCGPKLKRADIPPEGQRSSLTQSSIQSQREVTAMGRTNSQDQSVSSDSVQIESYGKHVAEQATSPYLMSNTEFQAHPHHPQVEVMQSAADIPFGYSDPYGLYSAYGPQAMIQPQMIGLAPPRVPLPLDLANDGPIYVNAKQYNAILRRRQKRAKLEAQNKLVKGRKPYLHESRHQHALNRVRGSAGRFLSTKKQNQAEPTPSTAILDPAPARSHHQNKNVQEMEVYGRFMNVPPQMAVSMSGVVGFTHNGTPHGAPAAG